jgi:hypothetical protein
MREGLKRMYGANRVPSASSKPATRSADAARAAATRGATYKSADAARAGAMKPSKPVAKSADSARAAAVLKARGQNMPDKTTKPVKKSGTTDPLAKAIFGAAKAIRGGSNQGMTAAQVAAENKRRANAAKNK